jgi:DNA polymerase
MFTEPTLRADLDKLADVWTSEATKKGARLKALGITTEDLQSAEKFATLLRAEGIEPATKPGKKGDIYAFAKTDPFMKELQEDEDERVRTLAEARLGAKSTLLQTRAETIGWMGRRGALCIYLRYAGAHTSRWSGGDGANWQNGVPAINDAIFPPDGYELKKPDASQVECRLLNFVAGQEDKVEDFRLGRDPYVGVAQEFCGHPVNRIDHPELRQAGKVVELQAGYGSGGEKIRATLRNKAKIIISPEEGEKYKWAYRNTHPRVVDLWKDGNDILADLANGRDADWGPTKIHDRRIWLPNGIPLIFETLEWHIDTESDDKYWRLKTRNGWQKMYGAKLVENLIQALARVVVSQAMLRIVNLGYRIVNMRHDDLWILVPKDGNESRHTEVCRLELCRTPTWLPGIPLDAEVH